MNNRSVALVSMTNLFFTLAICFLTAKSVYAKPAFSGEPTPIPLVVADTKKPRQKSTYELRISLEKLRRRLVKISTVAAKLAKMSKDPIPQGLITSEVQMWYKYSHFLKSCAEMICKPEISWKKRLDNFENDLDEIDASGNAAAALIDATEKMQEMNQSFSEEYLKLQKKMESENRQFTTITKIMKEKHEKVTGAINQVK